MTQSEAEFLKIGVRKYKEACDTIDAFREKISERLAAILRSKSSFGDLERDGHIPRQNPFSQKGRWGHWASATATGTVNGRELTIEIGVWWYGSDGWPPVSFYVTTPDGEPHSPLSKPPPHSRVQYGEVYGNKPCLFIEPGEEVDFEQEFDHLICMFASCYNAG